MAEPPTPATPAISSVIADSVMDSFNDFKNAGTAVGNVLDLIKEKAAAAGIDIEKMGSLTEGASTALGLSSLMVVGASDAFSAMRESIKGVPISTFTDQISQLNESIKKMGVGELSKLISNFGGDASKAGGDVSKLRSMAENLGASFIKSADNGLLLQTNLIQMAASTGTLGEVMKAAGPDFEHMNNLVSVQAKMITDSNSATKLGTTMISSYYTELGKIPGALSAVVSQTASGSDKTNLLTAAIQVASGSGQKYSDIMSDLTKVYQSYGLVGEDALKFSARMAEVAQKNNIMLSDMKIGILAAADAFKLYGANAENAGKTVDSAAQAMNAYVGALKESGLSGKEATGVAQEMITKLSSLSIAQKAFISNQSGGPGGLMGAFQMDKMIKEGKIEEFMEKSMSTIKRQFGRIITVEEASQSQAAASQYMQQILMLQKGPIAVAGNEQQAARILDAMRLKEQGKEGPKLSASIAQDTMSVGEKLLQTSNTTVSDINVLLQNAKLSSIVPSLGAIQDLLGERSGNAKQLSIPYMQRSSRSAVQTQDAGREGAATSREYGQYLSGERNAVENKTGAMLQASFNDASGLFSRLTNTLGAIPDEIKKMFTTNTAEAHKGAQKILEDLDKKKDEIIASQAKEQDNQKRAELSRQLSEINEQRKAVVNLDLRNASAAPVSSAMPVNRAINQPRDNVKAKEAVQNTQASHAPAKTEHTIKVEGICLKCHEKMVQGNTHVHSLTQDT